MEKFNNNNLISNTLQTKYLNINHRRKQINIVVEKAYKIKSL